MNREWTDDVEFWTPVDGQTRARICSVRRTDEVEATGNGGGGRLEVRERALPRLSALLSGATDKCLHWNDFNLRIHSGISPLILFLDNRPL